jgi:hypothetical protein
MAVQGEGKRTPFIRYLNEFVQVPTSLFAGCQISHVPPFISAVITVSDTENGPCGGTLSYSMQVDEDTGASTGTMTYSNYCEMDVVSSGTLSFSGIIDLDSDDFNLTMTFSNFTMICDDVDMDVILSGTFQEESTEYSDSLNLDMYLRDNSSGKNFWLNNYHIESVYSDEYIQEEMEISGRFYSSDYGYVTLSTEEPLIYFDEDIYPSDGILEATGAAGSWARFTALSSSTYNVQVDMNGDGSNDWDSGVLSWDD